jgi:tetrapyrrole methylase family protein/MazG family protein/ATP diphosphatase
MPGDKRLVIADALDKMQSMSEPRQTGARLPELVQIMRRLLRPDGCPWDRERTLETLRPYVIEEAHEVVDAIDRKDMPNLREELGDLLLQIVFQSELAGEHFGIDDVVGAICDKMVRRHPHVFGTETAKDSAAVLARWETLKAKEKKDRGVLDGVPVAMPALLRALRVGEKAAHLGLDWPDLRGPREKLDEELRELDEAIEGGDAEAIEGELGDVLFAVVSLARKTSVDPEAALRRTLERFGARVRFVEQAGRARGVNPAELPFAELDALWNEAKEALRGAR